MTKKEKKKSSGDFKNQRMANYGSYQECIDHSKFFQTFVDFKTVGTEEGTDELGRT